MAAAFGALCHDDVDTGFERGVGPRARLHLRSDEDAGLVETLHERRGISKRDRDERRLRFDREQNEFGPQIQNPAHEADTEGARARRFAQ